MTKHRLELFSDGVFAIVLTLLVLDLRLPHALGLEGLRELVPGLLVHAATFFVVGLLWTVHHNTLALVDEVRTPGLLCNLAALFWLTLLPFAAKLAAEHPLDPLGPSFLAGCYGFYTASLVATRLLLKGVHEDNPAVRRYFRRRHGVYAALAVLRLVCSGLAWVSPWWGYAALATVLSFFVLGQPADAIKRLLDAPPPVPNPAPAPVAAE